MFVLNTSNNSNCFTNTGTSVKKVSGGNGWNTAMVYGSIGYSSGLIYYQVIIDSINNDKSGFAIGLNHKGVVTYSQDIVIGLSGYAYNCNTTSHNYIIQKGDVIGVELNFLKGICSFYLNGDIMNVYAPINIGTTYYPVFHIYYVGDGLTLNFPQQDLLDTSSPSLLDFTWDIFTPGNSSCFQLSNSQLSVKKVSGGNTWDNAMVYGNQFITKGVYKFNVKIDSINNDKSGYFIGLARNNKGINKYDQDIGIGVSGYCKGMITEFHNFIGNVGDIYSLIIDFQKGKCEFLFNGISTNISFNLIDGEIYYPVIHLYYENDGCSIIQKTNSFTKQDIPLLNINPKNNGYCFSLSKNSVKKISGNNSWNDAYIYGTQGYSSGLISWEIIIDNVNQDGSGFVIGASSCNNGSIAFKNDIGIGMSGNAYNLNTTSHNFKGRKGDSYIITLDFNQSIITFKFNGKDTGLIGKLIYGVTYYPVIHLYYINDGFTFNSNIISSNDLQIDSSFQLNSNPKNNSYCFTLSNNNQSIQKISGGNTWDNAYIYGTQGYSSGKYYWEVTIDNVNTDGSGFVIGISKCNNGSIGFKGDLAIGMSGIVYGLNTTSHLYKPKKGDKYGISLDFDLLTVSFYFNGIDTNLNGKLIKGQTYYPVFHLYYVYDAFTVSFPQLNKSPLIQKTNSFTKQDIPLLNINPKNNGYCFSLNNNSVKKIGGGNTWDNAYIYGTQGYSSGIISWDIQIDNVNTDGSGFVLGVSKCNNGSIGFKSDIGLGMSGIAYGFSTIVSHIYKGKKGDKYTITLDFFKNTVYFKYNGIDVLSSTLINGATYYPVIHLYYQNDGFTFIPSNNTLSPIIQKSPVIQQTNNYPTFLLNTNPVNNGYCFSNNNSIVTKVTGGDQWENGYIYGSQGLSFGIHYWEIEIQNINTDGSGFIMGISKCNDGTQTYQGDICIGMSGYGYNTSLTYHQCLGKQGDKIGILLDFDQLIVKFYLNDQDTLINSKISSGTIYYPVIHLYYVNDSLKLNFPKSQQPIMNNNQFILNSNPKNNSYCFTLSNNNQSIKKISGGNTWDNAYIYGSKPLSFGIHYWEVEIENVNTDGSGFIFGISKCNNASIGFKNDIGLGMSGNAYGLNVTSHNFKGKKGDKYGIYLDFDNSLISFYYNGINTNISSKILTGTTYYPVFHLYYLQDAFKLNFPSIPKLSQNLLNINPKNNGYCFSLNNNSVKKIGGGNTWDNAYIYGTQGYSSGIISWDIQIDNVNTDGSGFVLGASKCNNGSIGFKNDFGLGMSGISYGLTTTSHNFKGKKGDKFTITLDFIKRIISFKFNGNDTGLIGYLHQGATYYPVIHLYYQNDGFTFIQDDLKISSPVIQKSPVIPTQKEFEKPIDLPFQLNTNPKNNSYCFSLINQTVVKISGGNTWDNAYIYGTKGLSSGRHEWEVEIENVNTDGSGFIIGISQCNNGSLGFSKDLGIGMSGNVYNLNTTSHNYKPKKGDKIGIILDFNLLKVEFKFNGKNMNLFGKLISNTIYYPVFHIYYLQDSFTLKFPEKMNIPDSVISQPFLLNLNSKINQSCFENQDGIIQKISGNNSWNDANIYSFKGYSSSGIYYWEVEIENVNKDGSGFIIGISECNDGSLGFRNDFAIGMSGNVYNLNTTSHNLKPKKGDRIGILLNLNQLLIQFSFNDINTGLFGKLKSDTLYYPVFHLYYLNDSFKLNFLEKLNQDIPLIKEISQSTNLDNNNSNLFKWNLLNNFNIKRKSFSTIFYNNTIYFIYGEENDQILNSIITFNIQSNELKYLNLNSGPLANRYMLTALYKDEIICYGGDNKSNDLWSLDLINLKWNLIQKDCPLKSRIYSSSCIYENDFFIFGGITDNDLHSNDLWSFNLLTKQWNEFKTNFKPSSRRYSTLNYFNDKLFLIAGRDNEKRFNDIWEFDLIDKKWIEINYSGIKKPLPMAAHSSSILDQNIFFFGGNDGSEKLPNELYRFNTVTQELKALKCFGDIPEGRYWHQSFIFENNLYILGGMGLYNITPNCYKIEIE